MIRSFLFLLILFTNSFAIRDILYKPHHSTAHRDRTLLLRASSTALNYPQKLSSQIGEDDKNVFVYSGHFRVIYGISYKDSASVQSLAKNISDIANSVWNTEIEELGFKQPRGSDEYYIDIYIGNKSAYNKSESKYITIGSDYGGYATAYSDDTPYFVINPSVDLDILKVTIAHEFFHTIQYAYGLDLVSDDIWEKNIWFLEASAVMMEDTVYDNVNDYVNYLKYYINNTNLSIEYHNEAIEYGKVLFAKFLRQKYGMDFIKSIFENYKTDKTILDVIKDEFAKRDISFKSVMLIFAKWVASEDLYFKDGTLFPSANRYSMDKNISIGNYGFALFNSGAKRYLVSSNPQYLQCNFNGKQEVLDDIDSDGLIFLNPKRTSLHSDIAKRNEFNGVSIKAGWNLISNIFDTNLSLENLFINEELVWLYRDGKYYAYSSNIDLEKIIKDDNISIPNNTIMPKEGIWVYSKYDELLDIDKYKLSGYDFDLKDGWNLISVSSSAFSISEIQKSMVVWHFNDKLQNWEYYCDQNISIPYKKFDIIKPGNAYFVLKKPQ